MIFGDILLELRAIRIGLELQLRLQTGKFIDLTKAAKEFGSELDESIQKPKPRTPDAIIHRNSDPLIRQQQLRSLGDDTERMLKEIGETYGPEKADQLREFYEKEIIGKK